MDYVHAVLQNLQSNSFLQKPRTPANAKLFICNKCQEGFESGQELVAHVLLVHEEKAISESELNG
jgi:hypothetical protein